MVAAIAISLGAFGAAGLGAATTASAHDELLSTGPADGAKVARVPAAVTLTFGEPPLELGARLRIVGPAGDVTLGSPKLSGDKVTQAIEPGAGAGKYTVQWKVTSGDGHPISGQFSFTAAAGGDGAATTPAQPPATTPVTTPAITATPTTAPAAVALSAANDTAGSDDSSSSPWPWVAGGAVVVALLAGGAVVASRRTRP
jgi:hypothetical protein